MQRAVVTGFTYHAQALASLVNAHSRSWRLQAFASSRIATLRALLALRGADALISVGGPAPANIFMEAARRRNLPVIVIWVGSDVTKAQHNPVGKEIVKHEDTANLAVAPWLVDELRELGIDAGYVKIAGITPGAPVAPIPAQFSVLTYLPEPRRAFYGAPLVYDLARAMPDVPFTVVGSGGPSLAAPGNVRFCGTVSNMPALLDESTVLVRQPEHDGTSVLVLEALARARHVVWNYDFPGVRCARGAEQVANVLQDIRAEHAAGKLPLNTQGRDYVLKHFGAEFVAGLFEEQLDRAVQERRTRKRATHRVAISGLDLFCAEVAQQVKRHAPEWEPRMLRTNSRLEVLTAMSVLAGSDLWYSIGSPMTDQWLHLVARLLRKPRVVHWAGSDIGTLEQSPRLRRALDIPRISHLAEVDWTAEQLREQGLEARIVPLPPRHLEAGVNRIAPLPATFTILLYVPRTRADLYGRESFVALMRRLRGRNVAFLAVGGGSIDAPAGVQFENLGWRDNLRDVYERSTLLIRNTPRDGLSLMVLEALSYGRHVLWTYQFPFVRQISGSDSIQREVLDLLDAHERGTLTPCFDAAQAIHEAYAPETCTRNIVHAWEEAARPALRASLAAEGPA